MPNDRAGESSHKFRDDESLLLTLQLESSASQRGGCGHTDRAAVRRHLPGNDDDVVPVIIIAIMRMLMVVISSGNSFVLETTK